MADIYVPELGESVADATVGKWLKQEGEAVKSGEALVELETDKINFEVEAEEDGVLESIAKGEGETVEVGEVIGSIGEGSGEPAASEDEGASEEAGAGAEEEAPEEPAGDSGGSSNGSSGGSEGEFRASPTVRKLAAEYEIDLASIAGSGSRVTREDVERAIREKDRGGAQPAAEENGSAAKESAPKAQPSVQPSGREDQEERIKFSRRRQTIAKRLVESQQTAAMLTTFNEVDMTAVMDLRRRRKDEFNERTGARLGFMSFFTKAAVAALKAYPNVNAELQETELVLKKYYDIGVAVSTDEGLVVPVLRDADRKSFAEIESGIADLAVKARDGKLSLADLSGGTFTITNGGIFGSLLSTPILTMPQVAILGMHKIQERPMVVDGEVKVRPMMYLALSYDHRVIDGREAVSFLVRIKELIEDPESLLLEG
ncbi:sucB: dihydrolipoyllysine-residue succinyltransferase, E2 component of oxoglutarate dehydrogenase (succinyl-transferring) complex [Rubrobacter radiotolerans]|uniref:Dihydrolipoyllysine-residue succinyltransferase component of 2-oxoglutarate dehydrogenase complex n=1 Tax=Rubrobacter radiotolerans TaxID=42256 RepID=A0A023X0H2_RUBRA|nr:2-oxoglutarate dehydrogenase complex dihydrolipoyllysine-residue succinyltransferase [Rubrobacter radiotolerans]AHY45701.1 sucB: dihydrolipoyllysine-residue succinyltransferase, E2 component of oxoglutarate dehydrogenase (succinyl-transferring) complex [Rubrobacter radiotolerans]MDX5893115.1 2-oxoglutarate dehydrogenase complex dihydrolipoyllysine-residue succinyltransferase [Rubrobacter radiotolerans]SMC03088.1 2-oxoglutarate dehydrogenase E2 component [Rubrobacter radiotolerans DSM 5868]